MNTGSGGGGTGSGGGGGFEMLGRSQVDSWIQEEPDTRLFNDPRGKAYYNFLRDSTVRSPFAEFIYARTPSPCGDDMCSRDVM